MSLFVAGVVIILGIAMIVAGVDGTGLSLFTELTGKTHTAVSNVPGVPATTTPQTNVVPASSGPAATGSVINA
jgi:hypothetical protein